MNQPRRSDAAVFTVGVGTGIALSGEGLLTATRALALRVGGHWCGTGRDLTLLAAKWAIVGGARAERPWRAVLGEWRSGAPVGEVAQLGKLDEEDQGQSQGQPGFKMKSRPLTINLHATTPFPNINLLLARLF